MFWDWVAIGSDWEERQERQGKMERGGRKGCVRTGVEIDDWVSVGIVLAFVSVS